MTNFPQCYPSVTLPIFCPSPSSKEFSIEGLAVSWEALFIYDTAVFGLTVFEAYRTRYGAGSEVRVPILDLILRDGMSLNTLDVRTLIWRQGAMYFA